jgi:chitin synthase
MRGSVNERMTQISRAEGWTIGKDASTSFDGESEDNVFGEGVKETGHVFLTYDTWKSVEDLVRAAEKDGKGGPGGYGGYEAEEDDMGTEYTHGGGAEGQMLLGVPAGYGGAFGGSNDNLLGQGGAVPTGGAYGPGGLTSPGLAPAYPGSPNPSDRGGDGDRGFPPKDAGNVAGGDMKVKEAPNAVEQIPSTRTRKWWLRTVWACTWLIPSFLLSSIGRMKRPDVRLAWREKVTIFWLIFLFNGIVIFYIVVFGRLLCPEYDKAWTLEEVSGHQGENDIYIAVRGVVYDVTDFIKGDHAQGQSMRSNDRDTIENVAGADMTNYFPPPLSLACPQLVADDANIQLSYKNFTPSVPQASTCPFHSARAMLTRPSSGHPRQWFGSDL